MLILDNCEHLIEACSQLANSLLLKCPKVSILATSRETLDIAGEVVYRLLPLGNPDPGSVTTSPEMDAPDAVRLFAERAAAQQPGFRLNSQNTPAARRICRRLDGIPLAIELAAGLISILSVAEIASRLDDSFLVLTGGSRTALPHHRTLRASLDWSYNLLSEPERLLIQRLSAFSGGWTLEAAESACSWNGLEKQSIMDTLAGLVKKSLCHTEVSVDGTTRYRMLVTIRELILEKLAENGDLIHSRHRDWFLSLAERAAPELKSHNQLIWFHRLDLELDNLRAALKWSLSRNETEAALRLVAALSYFWEMHGYSEEYRQFRLRALELAKRSAADALTPWLAEVLLGSVSVFGYLYASYPVPGDEEVEHALHIFQELGQMKGVGNSLLALACLSLQVGNVAESQRQAEQSLEIMTQLGDDWGIANCLAQLKFVAEAKNEFTQMIILGNKGVEKIRQTGDRWRLWQHLLEHAWLTWDAGETAKARLMFEENLKIAREFGNRWGEAMSLGILTEIMYHHGQISEALSYLDEYLLFERDLGFNFSSRFLPQIMLWQGNLVDAQAGFEEVQRLLSEDDTYALVLVEEGLGQIRYHRGGFTLAEQILQKAEMIAGQKIPPIFSKTLLRWIWRDLGDVARALGRTGQAMVWYRKSLMLMRSMGCRPFMPDTIEGIAKTACLAGQPELAVRLFSACQSARQWMEVWRAEVNRADYERSLQAARETLGENNFKDAWESGRTMTLEQAVELALTAQGSTDR